MFLPTHRILAQREGRGCTVPGKAESGALKKGGERSRGVRAGRPRTIQEEKGEGRTAEEPERKGTKSTKEKHRKNFLSLKCRWGGKRIGDVDRLTRKRYHHDGLNKTTKEWCKLKGRGRRVAGGAGGLNDPPAKDTKKKVPTKKKKEGRGGHTR